MRPCVTVLRNSFATSIPGRRIVWTYSARPVTLSRLSVRGSERPICEPTFAVVCNFSSMAVTAPCFGPGRVHRALDVDTHEFPLVRHGAARISNEFGFLHRRIRRAAKERLVDAVSGQDCFGGVQTCRLLGCGAGDDAR